MKSIKSPIQLTLFLICTACFHDATPKKEDSKTLCSRHLLEIISQQALPPTITKYIFISENLGCQGCVPSLLQDSAILYDPSIHLLFIKKRKNTPKALNQLIDRNKLTVIPNSNSIMNYECLVNSPFMLDFHVDSTTLTPVRPTRP